jgi:hypothetical protein
MGDDAGLSCLSSTTMPFTVSRSSTLRCSISLLCLLAGAAGAQPREMDNNLLDGRWTARVQPEGGAERTARVELRDFAGSWLEVAPKKGKGSPCAGRKLPITVQASNGNELEFTVWGRSVLAACEDLTIVMKALDLQRLEGTINARDRILLQRR